VGQRRHSIQEIEAYLRRQYVETDDLIVTGSGRTMYGVGLVVGLDAITLNNSTEVMSLKASHVRIFCRKA